MKQLFSKMRDNGGCIVSSGGCGTMEIADAQARGDFPLTKMVSATCCARTHGYRNTAGLRVGPMNRASSEVEDDGNGDGYWCVVCGRFLPASGGVVVHDDVPHPDNMSFDDGDNPQ
jgi:hypothetical protein